LLIVLSTPRAASVHSYSDPSSSMLETVHTYRSSSKATAYHLQSLRRRPQSLALDKLSVSPKITPFATLGLIADPYQLYTEIHHYSILHDVRELTIVGSGSGKAWRDSARLYTGIVQPTPPHAPSLHDPTQVQSAGTPLQRTSSQSQSQSQGDSRPHRPPSSVRSMSTSPSGPSSPSVDTPTVTQYPSAAPDRPTAARSH